MKKLYVNELLANTTIRDVFVIAEKEMRISRQGKMYLALRLSDRTGDIAAYHFDPTSAENEIPIGAVVSVQGLVGSYKNSRRININLMVPATQIDPASFMARSSRKTDEMLGELHHLVAGVRNKTLGRILRSVFADKKFLSYFCVSPGSANHHHDYIAGLLEHTVSVATACAQISARYPQANSDLLISGAILHDIGMTEALEYDTSVRVSEQGKLVGHSLLSVQRVREAARRVGVEEDDFILVELMHAIASHHGEDRDSRAQKPVTFEGILLADIDSMDIRAASFLVATKGAARVEEIWTDAQNIFERPLRISSGCDPEASRAEEEAVQFSA